MADWTGQIQDGANARGVWIRSSSLIEHIPTFPDDLRASDASSVPEEVDVTDAKVGARNRGPLTDPPVGERLIPQPAMPAPLYDESPDSGEVTPPTFDMGLLPATYADAEVTEEGDRPSSNEARVAPILRAAEEGRIDAVKADQEASVTLELVDGWMDHADQLDIEFPSKELLPVPPSNRSSATPIAPGRVVLPDRFSRPAKPVNRDSATPRSPLSRDGAPRFRSRPGSMPSHVPPNSIDGLPSDVLHSRASNYEETRPIPNRRTPQSRPSFVPVRTPPPGPSRFQRAGWWVAGAMCGTFGASILASLALAVAMLVI